MKGFTEHKLTDVHLFGGDSEIVLPFLLKEEVDAIVTDPPAGIGFMGKAWDSDKGGRDEWVRWLTRISRELVRILKPGGHALVWALPRTSHWTAMALENAGFEIRDVIVHLFGTGFPKSADVSKAIDKAAGAEREKLGPKATFRKPQSPNGWDCTKRAEFETAPSTDDAKRWQGFGTALKPASEHWILCRKPLVETHTTIKGKRKREKKTVAEATLKHGTGGLNIDATRIGVEKRTYKGAGGTKTTMAQGSPWADGRGKDMEFEATGRFPANLVLDEEAAAMLDEQSGEAKPKPARKGRIGGMKGATFAHGVGFNPEGEGNWPADPGGGASRFFYVAKASKKERGEDNDHPTVKPLALMSYLIKLITPPGGTVLDCFMGSGSTGVAAIQEGFKFIGIEKDPNYMRIAERRIANARSTANDQARSARAAHHE